MAIIKHIAIHQSPLKLIRYILNGDKTDEMRFATGLQVTPNVAAAYMEMSANFENISGERFYKKSLNRKNLGDNETLQKEKIRLHHYIQSFKPNEVTPEEAHRIGVEWAKKVFGENHQVLVTTHTNCKHIHNHFAVAAYNLDGKAWYDNKETLERCRDISDKICKAHGLSVIKKPKYHANQKYADWLARQRNVSWKTRLCDDIDKLVLREDVKSVKDLAEHLREKGYAVTLKKYLSIKAARNRKAVRSLRLGDGYGIEELQYRIENKDREISLSAVARYQGIQREYAMCLRELQITVYRKEENSHNVTYGELRRNAELLTYLCSNNIHSDEDFRNTVNAAAEKFDKLKKLRDGLFAEIEQEEKILQDGARFVELNKIKMPTADQLDKLAGLSYLAKYNLRSSEDIAAHGKTLETLKTELSDAEKNLEAAKTDKRQAAENYKTYLRQMQSDYDYVLEKLKREREEIRIAEQDLQTEQEQAVQTNQKYYR